MVYQKVYIFKCHHWYILLVFAILSKQKNKIGKKIVLQKKNNIWFSKSFYPKGTSGRRGGASSYIRVTTVVKVLVVLLCGCVFRSILIFNFYLF